MRRGKGFTATLAMGDIFLAGFRSFCVVVHEESIEEPTRKKQLCCGYSFAGDIGRNFTSLTPVES